MANALTTSFTHSYAGKEFLTKLFYQPQIAGEMNPFVDNFLFLETGYKQNLYKIARMEKTLRADTGCGFSASGSTAITDRSITPTKVKVNLEECEDAFDATIFAELRKKGIQRKDLTDTLMAEILATSLQRSLMYDIPALAFFGKDTDSDTFYGILDGYLKLALDGTSSLSTYLDMSVGTTYESAGALKDGASLAALRYLHENMTVEMRSMLTKSKIYVTSTVAMNLQKSYENTGTDSGLMRVQNSNEVASFRGFPIVNCSFFDKSLADAANPYAVTVGDNMIFWTLPENLALAGDVKSPETQVETWYEKKDEKYYTRMNFMFGVNFIYPELIALAI